MQVEVMVVEEVEVEVEVVVVELKVAVSVLLPFLPPQVITLSLSPATLLIRHDCWRLVNPLAALRLAAR
ncbi:hypothetical protein E2C01_063658 [Portunus trituberculatus]|uniref:Uncharacterized protein n=1 Tax=Portunus trituberculatus TaxID=210409 RepID=A0A5B7HGY2_PORTR|nr:hypothetical protein [Portunus trituberculatus]